MARRKKKNQLMRQKKKRKLQKNEQSKSNQMKNANHVKKENNIIKEKKLTQNQNPLPQPDILYHFDILCEGKMEQFENVKFVLMGGSPERAKLIAERFSKETWISRWSKSNR